MSNFFSGVVVKSTGKWYRVRLEQGEEIACRIIGKFRLEGHKLTNPVAVGDKVAVEIETGEERTGIIKKILPRDNYVVRQSPRRRHDLHLLAANIDQAVLIVTVVEPKLKQGFIDRFLLMTAPYDIPTIIVFNKADLYGDEDFDTYVFLEALYTDIVADVLLVSAEKKVGLDPLRAALNNKTSLVAGQSGVGKSTLINTIAPGLELRTTELSDSSGKGQHTTTFAEMHPFEDRGYIIDTPGIKTLSFNHLEPMDVAHNFKEFFEASADCRFGGTCLHRNEPGCAVKAAIAQGNISELRYFNYLAILEEIEDQNYWERIDDY